MSDAVPFPPGATCPGCGYDLRGAVSDRCAECGAALTVRVVASRAGDPWWWSGLVGLALATAMAAWILAGPLTRLVHAASDERIPALVRAGMAPTSDLPDWRGVIGLTLILVLAGAALGAWIAARRAARRRILLALAATAAPLLVLLLIAGITRVT